MKALRMHWPLAVLVLGGIFASGQAAAQTGDHQYRLPAAPALSASSDIAAMSLDFELVDGSGQRVSRKDFLGKNVLVAFGFTYCPDVCPVMAANMAKALRFSDKEAVGIFISVDTERDTPEVSANYASKFGENMIGLGGSHEQVSEAAKNFNVTFVVTKTPNSYNVQHSPGTFLVSPEGELIEVFAINADPKEIAAAMR